MPTAETPSRPPEFRARLEAFDRLTLTTREVLALATMLAEVFDSCGRCADAQMDVHSAMSGFATVARSIVDRVTVIEQLAAEASAFRAPAKGDVS